MYSERMQEKLKKVRFRCDNPVKYLVTDPCYVIPNSNEREESEWHKLLDECDHWHGTGDYGGGAHIWAFATFPRTYGRHTVLTIGNIPMGDISFSWNGKTFGADAGCVSIVEVPFDYSLDETEAGKNGYGILVDTFHEAEKAYEHALTYVWGDVPDDAKDSEGFF
jgi:hypothetical protein